MENNTGVLSGIHAYTVGTYMVCMYVCMEQTHVSDDVISMTFIRTSQRSN